MKISLQAKFWKFLSNLLDFFLNERVYHGEGSYERKFKENSPEK